MSRLKSFLKKVWRIFLWTLAVLTAAAAAALAPLFFAEREVPEAWTEALCEALSGDGICVSLDSASVKLPEGFRLRGLRLYDTASSGIKPLASVELAELRISFMRLLFNPKAALKRLRIRGLEAPRMPDSWYEPIVDRREKNEPVDLDLPDIRPFSIEICDSNVLGMKVEQFAISSLSVSKGGIAASGVSLALADTDRRSRLRGEARFDLASQKVSATLAGMARVRGVRPLIEALDARGALEYVDSFTALDDPVTVNALIDSNVANNDFSIRLDLNASGGIYRGIPLKSLSGGVDVRTCTRGTNYNIRVRLENMDVATADGSSAHGGLTYDCTEEVETIDLDVKADMQLHRLAQMADFLDDGTLDFIKETMPASIAMKGRVHTDPARAAGNSLDGTIIFREGVVVGIKVKSMSSRFRFSGTTLTLDGCNAESAGGGKCAGRIELSLPDFDSSRAMLTVESTGRGVPLADAGEALKVDLDGRYGMLDFESSLSMPASKDAVSGMNGRGTIKCREGRIAEMPLFAGFTSYISRNVPGVSFLVEQSDGSCDYTISNGVFRTENLLIEGSVFSIRGAGTLDMVKSQVDMTVRATVFRKGTFLGLIASPVTWTFTKLLLEFSVRGPADNPEWSLITLVDRIWNGLTFSGGDAPPPSPAPPASGGGAK